MKYAEHLEEGWDQRFLKGFTKKGSAECWVWNSRAAAHRYGTFSVGYQPDGRTCKVGAHIAAYFYFKGPVPEGSVVRHSCDNPKCVNPRHLLLGSTQDNRADCVRRGRSSRGEKRWSSKLRAEDVRTIRRLRGKVTQAELARRFGVTNRNVSRIQLKKTWKHI